MEKLTSSSFNLLLLTHLLLTMKRCTPPLLTRSVATGKLSIVSYNTLLLRCLIHSVPRIVALVSTHACAIACVIPYEGHTFSNAELQASPSRF